MNRREFTRGLAALGVAPALPLPSLAKAIPVAGIAPDPMYVWAQFITRVHDKCSPAMLTRLLRLDTGHADRLYAELLKDGVIGPANAFGISKATDPLYQEYAKIGANRMSPVETIEKPDLKSAVKDRILEENSSNEDEDSQCLNPEDPNSHDEPDDTSDSIDSNSEDPTERA